MTAKPKWSPDLLRVVDEAGYTIVPKEPTIEMSEAATETDGGKLIDSFVMFCWTHGMNVPDSMTGKNCPLFQIWRAMLAAAA